MARKITRLLLLASLLLIGLITTRSGHYLPILTVATSETPTIRITDEVRQQCQRWMGSMLSQSTVEVDSDSKTVDLDQLSRVRIFNQCVFKVNTRCNPEVERSTFDWLSGMAPRITNTKVKNEPLFRANANECYTQAIQSTLRGKGLVLTATDAHFKSILNLIVLLRTLDTRMSLQIVHKGEISDFSQQRLLLAATSNWSGDRAIMSMLRNPKYKSSFRKLDLSFIDVSLAIKPEYKDRFVRFNNKLLANFFNTFEESMLIDTDTVFLKSPDEFLQFDQYISKGTFFFKDRSLANTHKSAGSISMFKSMLPTMEDAKYGINQVSSYTLNQRFFHGFLHLQEAGVVLIDRRRHFETSLMAAHLSLHRESIMELTWGDKELYWLSFAISGDESYHFNHNHAASVGELSPDPDHSHYPHLHNLREICSSHPAHIADDNHTLLWMNSGFKHCKKTMYHDETNPFFKGWTQEEKKKYNTGPIRIKAALIPPEPPTPGLTPVDDIPTRGWVPRDYCEMYTICAYTDVAGYKDKGILLEFSEEEQHWFNYLSNSWFSSIDVLKHLARL